MNLHFHVLIHRLCVCASGSWITYVFSCSTLIKVFCLHFGQNSGKFLIIVLGLTFIRVLLLHTGHNIHSSCDNFHHLLTSLKIHSLSGCQKNSYLHFSQVILSILRKFIKDFFLQPISQNRSDNDSNYDLHDISRYKRKHTNP